jgi:esterase/lipase superfamily enzyme
MRSVRSGIADRSAISRRTALRGATALGLVLPFAGCTALSSAITRPDAPDITAEPTLLVATTRKPVDGARAKPWFGTERAAKVSFARAKLVPPDQGRFSLAAVGLGYWSLEGVELVSRFNELLPVNPSRRDFLLYVHGFNQSFETAALDAARLSASVQFHGPTMIFTWPSKEKLLDYGYDRESAMWSRDAMERLLTALIANERIGRIHIVAHSVGTMLSLEALRQVYARNGIAGTDKIGAVVFASPDIDMDVFTSSLQRMPPLAPKITVITATNDRALAVAGWIAGGMTRVGAAEKAQLEKLGLRVIDASAQGWGIINHDLFLSNDQITTVIHRAIEGTPDRISSAMPPQAEPAQ